MIKRQVQTELDRAKASQAPIAGHLIQIADTVKHRAVTIGGKLWDAYYSKGGLHEMEQKLKEKMRQQAAGVYELGQTAWKLAHGNPAVFEQYFALICKPIEAAIKAKAEKAGHPDFDNVAKCLPVYPVYKSEIRRAVKAGIDLSKVESWGAMKAAREDKETAARAPQPGGQAATQQAGATDANVVQAGANAAAAVKVEHTTKLAAVLTVQAATIARMAPETQDDFALELSRLVAKYAKKLDKASNIENGETADEAPEGSEPAAEGERQSA